MEAWQEPILYADMTFLLQLLLDFLLLYWTGKLCLLRVVYGHMAMISLLGGLYGTFCMAYPQHWGAGLGCRLLFSLLLLGWGLHPANIRDWRNCLLVFYLLNLIAAGVIFFLEAAGASALWLWLLTGIGLWGLVRQGLRAGANLLHRMTQVEVEICLEGQILCCHGFVDTGNHLLDPVAKKPVVVIQQQLFIPLLQGEIEDWLQDAHWQARLRWLSYSSLGKRQGILPGLQVDKVILHEALQTVCHSDIVVALTTEKIPDCLVPAGLL